MDRAEGQTGGPLSRQGYRRSAARGCQCPAWTQLAPCVLGSAARHACRRRVVDALLRGAAQVAEDAGAVAIGVWWGSESQPLESAERIEATSAPPPKQD